MAEIPPDSQRKGFTLDKLAQALRGIPRDARMLIRLPDGRLVDIDYVKGTHVRAAEGGLIGDQPARDAAYGVVLVPLIDEVTEPNLP